MNGDEKYCHKPVLLAETLQHLRPESQSAFMVDGTTGEGGHSEAFLRAFPSLKLACLDADAAIQERAKRRLSKFADRTQFFRCWFDEFFEEYPTRLPRPDLILFDLGISMFHYEMSGHGFSFRADEPLDMRLSGDLQKSAADLVNDLDEGQLADLLFKYGEERQSRRIARAIVMRREKRRFDTAVDLASVIFDAVSPEARRMRLHPATKTFQALRIAVNDELSRLERVLAASFAALNVGGKIAVITFHSLEDRIVKNFFREKAKNCICPPEMPICMCRGRPECEILTRKAVLPGKAEIEENAPSRSAKLRVVKKVFEATAFGERACFQN